MAIIYNDHTIEEIAEATRIFLGSRIFIIVYSGSQPTISNYESNWTTNYFYDTTTPTYGTDVLVTYGNATTSASANALEWILDTTTDGGWQIVLTDTEFDSTHVGNGTATFAAIWDVYSDTTIFGSGDTTLPSVPYMLVPVTGTTGNGAIKLSTTTISGSAPTLSNINLTFGGSS